MPDESLSDPGLVYEIPAGNVKPPKIPASQPPKGFLGRPSKAASHAKFSQGNSLYNFYEKKGKHKRKTRSSGPEGPQVDCSADSEQPPPKIRAIVPEPMSTMDPSMKQLLTSLNAKMDTMQSTNQTHFDNTRTLINGISTKVDDIKGSVDVLKSTVHAHKAETDASIEDLRKMFAEMECKIIAGVIPGNPVAESALMEIQSDMSALKEGLDAVQKQQHSVPSAEIEAVQQAVRRTNVVIKGLVVDPKAAFEEVSNFFSSKLNFTGRVIDVRIRRQPTQPDQFITVTLDSTLSKRTLLRSKKVLFGTNIYIDPDLTPAESKIASCIREEGRKLKALGRQVRNITPISLIVDGKFLLWDRSKTKLVAKNSLRHSVPSPTINV